jgi:signal transduction histidine kinase
MRLRARDGTYRWVLASMQSDEATGEVYVVAKDIHERRLADEHLRSVESELRFRIGLEDLVTSMSTRFFGVPEDELQQIVEGSLGELCAYFGLDRAYVLKTGDGGPATIDFFVEWWVDGVAQQSTPIPELAVDAQRFWVRTLRSGQPVHVPDVRKDPPPGGEAAMETLARDGANSILFVPLQARDATIGFMGFEARRSHCSWSDETIALMRTVGELYVSAVDRSRAERALANAAEELERRNAELERSNKELEQFASIVSHDLKSPLQVVRGFVELLGREAESHGGGGDAQTYVAAALRGTSRMDRLIDDLLIYSRAGQRPAVFVPVALDTIASEVLADSAALIEESDAAILVDPLPRVEGDTTQLRQLLQNLVTNAIKFRRTDAPPSVRVHAGEDADRWIVYVDDNGIGIEPEHRQEIFAMFTRLHAGDRPGSGIGLAICARVVANHGGEIWAEDGPGGGARLCFTLAKDPGLAA